MVGIHYRHANGNLYKILALSKTKIEGKWLDSVTYVCPEGHIYNRIATDFYSGRFTKVETRSRYWIVRVFKNLISKIK